MSAEILRRAASQMRERAESATPGRWENRRGPGEHVVTDVEAVATIVSTSARADRRHIASWHPAVALAVADWLEVTANCMEVGCDLHGINAPLAVARAYMQEASDV